MLVGWFVDINLRTSTGWRKRVLGQPLNGMLNAQFKSKARGGYISFIIVTGRERESFTL